MGSILCENRPSGGYGGGSGGSGGLSCGLTNRGQYGWFRGGGCGVLLCLRWLGACLLCLPFIASGTSGTSGASSGLAPSGGRDPARAAALADAGARGTALASEDSLASRPRRPRRGKLYFGTYEAWCSLPDFLTRPEAGGFCLDIPAVGGYRCAGEAVPRGGGAFIWGPFPCSLRADPGPFWSLRDSYRKPVPTLQQVSGYFAEALGETPHVDGERRQRFERWEGFSWGASWRKCILSGGRDSLCLEWWANDDFGVSELREFFEAPFFEVSEAQTFHSWLGEGGWHRGTLRGQPLSMGVLARDEYVYVRLRWWRPED